MSSHNYLLNKLVKPLFDFLAPQFAFPRLALVQHVSVDSVSAPDGLVFDIRDQMRNGMLFAVPKSRRSREKRLMRKHGWNKLQEWATPKTDLIMCYECGNWHAMRTICGKCYEKVRQETELLMKQVRELTEFNADQRPLKFIYSDDPTSIEEEDGDDDQEEEAEEGSRKMEEKLMIVEVDRPRPLWFARNLLTPGNKVVNGPTESS